MSDDQQLGPSPGLDENTPPFDYDLALYHHSGGKNSPEPYWYTLDISGVSTTMEIDTGAASSIISEKQYGLLQGGKSKLVLLKDQLPRLYIYVHILVISFIPLVE